MSHTKTPYEFSRRNWCNELDENGNYYITGDRHSCVTEDDDGTDIDDGESCVSVAVVTGNSTSHPVTRDTAEFICRACNCFDDLVEACAALDSLDCCDGYSFPESDWPKFWEALNLARAVLPKARTLLDESK